METAEIRMPLPESLRGADAIPAPLAADLARPGYQARVDGDDLVVTRTGKLDLSGDPDALAPHIDQPFEPQEEKNLAGVIAAYEADLE